MLGDQLEDALGRGALGKDDPGGADPEREQRGKVPREDVAAVLAEVLTADSTIGKKFELFSGETPIADPAPYRYQRFAKA